MARQTADQDITTRTARLRLAPRKEPYWRGLDQGAAIGYRKGATGTFWIARVLASGTYQQASLARADDTLKADGTTVLDYRQAVEQAKAWVLRQHQRAAGHDPDEEARGPYTVADALADYVKGYEARGGKDARGLRTTINAHVLPHLGKAPVASLTTAKLSTWHHSLATSEARLRMKKDASKAPGREAGTPDEKRARRASANRVLTVLKAALNHAFVNGQTRSDDAWRRLKPFKNVDAARVRYLNDGEARRLVNACPADFRSLVVAALLTGCRYGELAALRVSDVDLAAGTLSVRVSKGGSARHVVLTSEASDLLRGLIAGKASEALIFIRADGEPWGKSHQFRPLREACSAARIGPAVSFHILRHTHASRLAGKGVPMAVVAAQLGHADTRITSKHYAHLAPSYVADTIRTAFGLLDIGPEAGAVVAFASGSS